MQKKVDILLQRPYNNTINRSKRAGHQKKTEGEKNF